MAEDGERSNDSELSDDPEQLRASKAASKADVSESSPDDEPATVDDGPKDGDRSSSASASVSTSVSISKEGDDSPADDTTSADTAPDSASGSVAGEPRRRASKLWWALPILMVVEFYFYGHNGRLEICVGKEGDTDFSLVGQPRTDENRWKFPRCETRLNLGLRSQKEAKIEEGLKVACRGATIFRHQGEAKACVAKDKGWVHQIEGHFVPPWAPAYYKHLFWFLQ
ncbi:MAG: hypothetical protein AAGF11_55400 [Myxococcota bacterium]